MSNGNEFATKSPNRIFVTGDCDGLPDLREALGAHPEVELVGSANQVMEAAPTLTGGHLNVVLHATRAATLPVNELAAIREHTRAPLILLALSDSQAQKVQYLLANAGGTDAERWHLELRPVTHDADSPDHRSEITVRGVLPNGDTVSVSGTLSGPRMVEKLTDVLGFDVDLVPVDHLVFLRYADRPGVVGTVGAALGEAQVNIAGAQVSRTSQGGDALMALTVDSAVPAEVLEAIGTAIGAHAVRAVDLT